MNSDNILQNDWLNQIKIRFIRRSDLSDLEWDGEYAHFRRVYADAYQRVIKGLSLIWVAELPGVNIVGQVFIQLNCDRPELADGKNKAYLYAFRIREKYRDQGLGSKMMTLLEKDLCNRRYQTLTLNVAKDNPRAQELYKRLGFEVTAEEPGVWSYPDDKGIWRQVNEPAWRMEKRLR